MNFDTILKAATKYVDHPDATSKGLCAYLRDVLRVTDHLGGRIAVLEDLLAEKNVEEVRQARIDAMARELLANKSSDPDNCYKHANRLEEARVRFIASRRKP